MARYHLSPNAGGEPRKCSAKIKCEFADANNGQGVEHYNSKSEAEQAYVKNLAESNKSTPTIFKKAQKGDVKENTITSKKEENSTPVEQKPIINYKELIKEGISNKFSEATKINQKFDTQELTKEYASLQEEHNRSPETIKDLKDQILKTTQENLVQSLIDCGVHPNYAKYYVKKQLTVLGYLDTYTDVSSKGQEYTIYRGKTNLIGFDTLLGKNKQRKIEQGVTKFFRENPMLSSKLLSAQIVYEASLQSKEKPTISFEQRAEKIKELEQIINNKKKKNAILNIQNSLGLKNMDYIPLVKNHNNVDLNKYSLVAISVLDLNPNNTIKEYYARETKVDIIEEDKNGNTVYKRKELFTDNFTPITEIEGFILKDKTTGELSLPQ